MDAQSCWLFLSPISKYKAPGRTSPPSQQQQQQQQPTVSASVVKKLLQLHWGKDKGAENPKINPNALKLTAEYLRLFVIGEAYDSPRELGARKQRTGELRLCE